MLLRGLVCGLTITLGIGITCLAQQAPVPRIVSLSAADGTVLKGTYFGSQKPGPGVLLLHQCNQDRKLWDPLGERLAASGINVLTLDYRGFGESGGPRFDKLSPQELNKMETDIWPGDIDMAFRYLLSQPGVDRDRVGAGGASCGVDNSIQLARRHKVKALMLLAGPTDRAGRDFLQSSKSLPIFTSAADDDIFGPQNLRMQWLFSLSSNTASRFAHYGTGGHGAEMFAVHKELPDIIAKWFVATLENSPGSLPKTNGSPFEPPLLNDLTLVDQIGGVGARQIAAAWTAQHSGPKLVLLPEFIVNLLGYEHIQLGDTKGAVEIMKLNATAYPNSANVYDSLSDAYLADGQKDLALENARKAVELLKTDTVDPEQLKNGIRDSAEQKIKQLSPPNL